MIMRPIYDVYYVHIIMIIFYGPQATKSTERTGAFPHTSAILRLYIERERARIKGEVVGRRTQWRACFEPVRRWLAAEHARIAQKHCDGDYVFAGAAFNACGFQCKKNRQSKNKE